MTKTVVIIPTYNEKENIVEISERVLALDTPLHIIIVDDNSPDGTGRIADQLSATRKSVSVIHRPRKAGLGKAYVAGMGHALEKGYATVVTMDADLSHDPNDIPRFLDAVKSHDLVVGSRYTPGGGVENWPWYRRLMSRVGSAYARTVAGLPVRDATGGFNCYRRELLEAVGLDSIRSEGYSFQIEMKHRAWRKGFRIREIPILFVERRQGQSKMSWRIFMEAIFRCWKLRFSRAGA